VQWAKQVFNSQFHPNKPTIPFCTSAEEDLTRPRSPTWFWSHLPNWLRGIIHQFNGNRTHPHLFQREKIIRAVSNRLILPKVVNEPHAIDVKVVLSEVGKMTCNLPYWGVAGEYLILFKSYEDFSVVNDAVAKL